MSVIVRLVYGGKTLELNDGVRFLIEDGSFTPPASETQLNLSGSRSAAGGRVIGKQAQDRRWSFEVVALGSSYTQTNQAVSEVQAFLDLAGQSGETLYLEYCMAAHIPYRPTYGQAGWHRYEIKFGQARLREYAGTSARASVVQVDLTIGPYKLGLPQNLMRCRYGIWEDDLFASRPRGTVLLPATTNYFTNPIFQYAGTGSSSDWYSGWSIGSDLEEALIVKDKSLALFGDACMMIRRYGNTNYLVTQSITAPSTQTMVISCYARRRDKGTIDANVIKVYYDAAEQTTYYVALEDGWYRVWASFTGVASAKAAGVAIKSSNTVLYLTGFQFEANLTYPRPFVYGDMVGCRWSGARHNSTSVTGNIFGGHMKHDSPSVFFGSDYAIEGCIRVAFRWYYPSTYGSSQYIFDAGNFEAYYNQVDDKIYFTDGSNTISTAAQTFAAGDLVVLHFVFGATTMKIYKNGVEAATGNAFANTASAGFYLLTDDTGAYHACATLLDFATWIEIPSATDVLADYTELYQHISAGDGSGQRAGSTPWRWLEDGALAYEYIDSTHSDWCVIGGVDGDAPAQSKFFLTGTAGESYLLSLNTYEKPISIVEEFQDLQGTVVAGALNGQVLQQSVNTTEVFFPASGDTDILNLGAAYYGKVVYAIASIADAGANLTARLRCKLGSGYVIYSDYKPIAANATLKRFLIGPIILPEEVINPWGEVFLSSGALPKLEFAIGFIRTAAGAANVNVDYYRVLVGKVAYIPITDATHYRLGYQSNLGAMLYHNTSSLLIEKPLVRGDVIEFEPNKYNYLHLDTGDLGGAVTTTWEMGIIHESVIQRWSLL